MISGPAAWAPDPKCPSGCVSQSVAWGPHLKPRVGVRPDKRPGWAHRQKPPGWARNQISGCLPLCTDPKLGNSSQPKSQAEIGHTNQSRSGCLQATTPKSTGSEKLLPSPCTQNPVGPTGSLGGRQNAQQRGAAGLGETAFPGKTGPSRGMNYPIAAPKAPSI